MKQSFLAPNLCILMLANGIYSINNGTVLFVCRVNISNQRFYIILQNFLNIQPYPYHNCVDNVSDSNQNMNYSFEVLYYEHCDGFFLRDVIVCTFKRKYWVLADASLPISVFEKYCRWYLSKFR